MLNTIFLSTPSARRATCCIRHDHTYQQDFYPRPPRGGRPSRFLRGRQSRCISIHALREEGDVFPVFVGFFGSLFLSTPSARRATCSA